MSASLECGGLAPLCSRAERAIPEVNSAALRVIAKRRQAAALQGALNSNRLTAPFLDINTARD